MMVKILDAAGESENNTKQNLFVRVGLGKYSKIKIGIFCVQGHEGGGGQSGGKKDTKVF